MGSPDLPTGLIGADFYAVAEASPDFIALAWLDNTVAYVNPAGRRLVGLGSLEEARTHSISDYLTEEGLRASTAIEQPAVIEHGYWQGRSALRHFGTGRAIPVEITSFLVRDPATGDPRVLATFQRDISAQVLLEDRLRQAEKLEAVGRLAGAVAHDFNNILTIVLGYAELAASRDPGVARAMEELSGAAVQGAQITRQLLALTRRDVVRPRALELNAVVRSMLPVIRTLAGESIKVTAELGQDTGAVRADEAQLRQILLNLCANARDAMRPQGGGTLTLVTRRGRNEDHGALSVLAVRDDGLGIAPEHLDRVTEPFFTTKPETAGTGLGLATVASIVEGAGGVLRIESALGRGTTAWIGLPWMGMDAAAADTPESGALRSVRGSETVLVVEDDARVRRILRTALEAHGYDVRSAADGDEAVAELERDGALDLVVTDMILPRRGGASVAALARERHPGVRVILISGDPQSEESRDAAREAVEFLPKPFDPARFLRVVRRVLDA
jgi:two-component system, cell cycle sensor histidine kinase and response regulator CckA